MKASPADIAAMERLCLERGGTVQRLDAEARASCALDGETQVVGQYTFMLPYYRPPTLNQLFSGKLRDRIKRKKECYEIVGAYFLRAYIPRATCKRRVDVTMFLEPRQRFSDSDARWKTLLDGLVRCGALLSDDPASVELGHVEQFRMTTYEVGTRITLTDLR